MSVLTSDIDQLFQSPFDCIYDDLIAVRNIINFTRYVAIPSLKSIIITSSLPDHFDCDMIDEYITEKFEFYTSEIEEKIMDFSGLATSFANIHMHDLFLNFLFNHQICAMKSLAYVAAGSVNGNEQEILNYLSNNEILSFPLNCTQTNIDKYSNRIIASYETLFDKISNPQMSSLPPICESLSGVIAGLKTTVFGMLSRIENQTVYGSIRYHALRPGYIENVRCKVEMILQTIARRLEDISGIPFKDIYNILQGHDIVLPLNEPLNCIQDDLIQISHRTEYVVGDFIVFLESLVLSRLELIESCQQVEHIIGNLTDSVNIFIYESTEELKLENEDFSGLTNGYEYISSIMTQECEKKSLSRIFSSALNGDYDMVINLMNDGESFTYPYNCVTNEILNSIIYARQLLFDAGLYYL
ncbi:hypothetical protein ACKWTF_016783 [Chironomus riparius]